MERETEHVKSTRGQPAMLRVRQQRADQRKQEKKNERKKKGTHTCIHSVQDLIKHKTLQTASV